MKILFFVESLRSGGKERRMVELIKGLAIQKDIEIELVLIKKNIHYKDIFDTGIKIHFAERKILKKDPLVFYKFFKIARNFKPDIIHVWGNMVAIYAIPTKLILKIPMINNQITNAPESVPNSILGHKLPFLFSNRIVANSYAGLKSYNAPEKKSDVVYNGFDFKRINNLKDIDKTKKNFNISTEYIIGMVASFSDKKDYETYIRAANKILETMSNVTFLSIGSGDCEKYKLMVEKGNNDKILFLGKQENVESIMNVCNIGVLSTYTEGVSNALLEFMALSKPVISNDAGGTKELVIHNENGFLIKHKDHETLSNKINYLLSNFNEREKFGKKSRAIVEEKFSILKMIDDFKIIYNKILLN